MKALISNEDNLTQCQSLEHIDVASSCFDYIFIDPPFGANLNYSELNSLWEAWLKVSTDNKPEAIENKVQGKGPQRISPIDDRLLQRGPPDSQTRQMDNSRVLQHEGSRLERYPNSPDRCRFRCSKRLSTGQTTRQFQSRYHPDRRQTGPGYFRLQTQWGT